MSADRPDTPSPSTGLTDVFTFFRREEHAVKRTWTVELKDGTRVHTGDYDVDVEGGALTFRDVDGEVVHAYGQWRECHLDQGGRR